jgi:hypothetical protein
LRQKGQHGREEEDKKIILNYELTHFYYQGESMKKRNIIAILTLVSLLFCIYGLATAQNSGKKTLVSTDNHSSLSVPASWDTISLNNAAVLQCGNGSEEAYAIVINDAKMDLDGWNMQRHSYIVLGNLLTSVSSPKVQGPKKLKINGYNALQYEIQGSVDGQNVVYFLTDIETPHVFSQVLCWTLLSRTEKNRGILDKVVKSFTDPDVK